MMIERITNNIFMTHQLPPLPYASDALEPWIDAETMTIHHSKHHQAYVDKTNAIVEGLPTEYRNWPIEKLLGQLTELPIDEKAKTMLRNQGGGHANHSFFWTIMGPEKSVDQPLSQAITARWGSLDAFKTEFSAQSVGHFGSGWTWLVRDGSGELQLYTLPNQDSPLLVGHQPLIALDLWEHAYYLKYKNLRAKYVEAWWNVLKLL